MPLTVSPEEMLSRIEEHPRLRLTRNEWRAVDGLIAVFLLLLSVIEIFFAGRIHNWYLLVGANLAFIALIGVSAYAVQISANRLLQFVFDWYPAPSIFLVFKEVYFLIQGIGLTDMDHILIAADRALTGVDPTMWIYQFAHPVLTEVLQIAYLSYFAILVGVGAEVYIRRQPERFDYYLFLFSFGFFVSYIGYLLLPGIGPRFTLHRFSTLDQELPGLWLTIPIRAFINAGESIPSGVADAWRYAQRDVFPSGHTELTVLGMYLGFHWRLKSRWPLFICGTLLIISTVYLRYHYLVDVIAGVLTAVACIYAGRAIYCWWSGCGGGVGRTEGRP